MKKIEKLELFTRGVLHSHDWCPSTKMWELEEQDAIEDIVDEIEGIYESETSSWWSSWFTSTPSRAEIRAMLEEVSD